jgi:hypothetical protein
MATNAIKISTPDQFIARTAAIWADEEDQAFVEKLPKIEAIRDRLAMDFPDRVVDMDTYLNGIKQSLKPLKEDQASTTGVFIKRILVCMTAVPLAIYLYNAKDKLPNLEGLAHAVSNQILPWLGAKAASVLTSPEVTNTFKPGIEYWTETGGRIWQGYDYRQLALGSLVALGAFLALAHESSAKKEAMMTL